jgi:hypothetical protein
MAMAIPMTNLEDWLLVRMIDKYNLVRFLYTVMSNKQLITAIISKKKKKKKYQKPQDQWVQKVMSKRSAV